MSNELKGQNFTLQSYIVNWLAILLLTFLTIFIFFDGLESMVRHWLDKEEYSHGILIPFVALYLFYQKKNELVNIGLIGSWAGLILVFAGCVFFIIGELSTLYTIVQYAFLITLAGLILSFVGRGGFKKIWAPILILLFMIPLPNFIYFNLSSELQLISSQLGVMVIRLFGISVFLEGNVIDLGNYKLQVVEACSGLRYLFPLMSFAFICAYMFKGRFWMRAVVFLSSIPITVIMNSFRIGVIGVLVEHFGIGAAEGFLHDFEGWIIFIACTGILLAEIWVLNRIFGKGDSFLDVFALDYPRLNPEEGAAKAIKLPKPFLASIGLLFVVAVSSSFLTDREEIYPARAELIDFPVDIAKWKGNRSKIKDLELEVLKLTDYVITNYSDGEHDSINYYVAYYASQRKGASVHSPRACIPGGGWRITDFAQRNLANIKIGNTPLVVNRLVIQLGDTKQLVYYWFLQRGRVITNEYMAKWYLFWDALTRNRTDGALIRLTTFVKPGTDVSEADRELTEFAKAISPELTKYIPD